MGLGNLLGNPDKAVLLVRKPNAYPDVKEGMQDIASVIKNKLVAAALLTAGGLHSATAVKEIAKQNQYFYFEFQYNPESITLSSSAGSTQTRQGPSEAGINNITRTNVNANTMLSLHLWFYDLNTKDAFTADKLVLASLADAANAVQAKTCTYSVQKEVEGLMSLLMQHSTRQVIFVYGSTIFKGELEQCEAQYKMFNTGGNPIAAEVSLQIRQSSHYYVEGSKNQKGESYENLDAYDESYWNNALNTFIGNPGNDNTIDTRTMAQKLGGILNLNG